MSHPTVLRRSLGIFAFIALHLWQINGQNCSSLPVFNFTFNSQNPNINVPTVFPANSNIRITGTVNFNANVTMPRCTLLMDQGAILNINNSTFTLTADVAGNRSVIFGCTTMWQAINVNQGAAVIFRDCTIGDGRLGLVFNQGFNNSLTELRGNFFVANSTAITANNVNNFTFATFSGNVFRAKWGIGPIVLPLLPPHGANEPIYGMQLAGVAGTIGHIGSTERILSIYFGNFGK